MKIKKLLNPFFLIPNIRDYREIIEYDEKFYLSWSGKASMDRADYHRAEWKYLCCFRKAKVNKENIWGSIYRRKLEKLTNKYGIWIPADIQCGKGMIIAHWGRIIVNPGTIIGDEFSISSGVVIGRDIRGRRKGTPVFGNRVCIKTNAAVIGNVKIGDDVLIAPNAYVNFDVPSHSIVVGNPATTHSRENATEGYLGRIE